MANLDFTKMSSELKLRGMHQNSVSESEFATFVPLYKKDSRELSDEEVEQLTNQFQDRFNLYSPIIIHEDGDPSSVLTALPPVFGTTRDMNTIPGGSESMETLKNVITKPQHPLRRDLEAAMEEVKIAIRRTPNEDAMHEIEKVWEAATGQEVHDEQSEGTIQY